ncbi:MAG TPA: tRNA (guanosine(37)-N1)-methyltransferase TrmD [Patescibacteria group bacterium]|nr:tRNA (guanosine(37)-N1)-methyltransferase TrmD [Patescibacteria group bacterium]
MKIYFISLFSDIFDGALNTSILKRASDQKLVSYEQINLRDFGLGKHKQVDDTPYGGGAGMLLKPEPIISAIEFAKKHSPKAIVILPTPRGKIYTQKKANELAKINQDIIFVCPRYEGYDERILDWVDYDFCIGNYIITGGELPALIIADSIIRLIPNVLGNESSNKNESFQDSLSQIEYPQYTKPQSFKGKEVPAILLSGNHQEIVKWRKKVSN